MALYEKYKNIQTFLTKYRKYEVSTKFLDEDAFHMTMNNDTYIKIECTNPADKRPVIVYFLHPDSDYSSKQTFFLKLITWIKKPSDVIFIFQKEPSIYISKALLKPEYNHLTKYVYFHINFALEIPKGPHCSQHTIVDEKEKYRILHEDLKINPLNLPVIYENDVQCIWIGAKVGDLLRIDSYSPAVGKTIRYRIVSPPAGKAYIKYKKKNETTEGITEEDTKEDTKG